jgi:phosphomethylpyrimidine synthase
MRITQDIRDYAERTGAGAADAVRAGLEEKAAEFRNQGGNLYS